MYGIRINPLVKKRFHKLSKKNPKQLEIINSKLLDIIKDPHRYKNLRSPLNNFKRVHIDKHFVLIFSIDEENKLVRLKNYDHHDNIYNR